MAFSLKPTPTSFPTTNSLFNRISEGQFYEAHQQLRVVASRYVKQENWVAAIDILYGGALALLKAGQGGSGGDLCLYMVEVYGKGAVDVGAESKGKCHGMHGIRMLKGEVRESMQSG